MAAYTKTQVVDASPGADTVKQAVLDVDTDLTGAIAAYNAHDPATTNVHGFTGAKTGSGAMVGANSPALITPALGTPASGNLANCTGTPLNSQATAENDVLVGTPTPFGSWVKKTLAEFKTILGLGSAAYTASTAYDAAGTAAGKIASSISDGDTTHAPDGNSVFDALALKAPLISPNFTTPDINTATAESINGANILAGSADIGVGATKTVTVSSGSFGYTLNFGIVLAAGDGKAGISFVVSGNTADAASEYAITEVGRWSGGNAAISATTKNSGNFTFTITSTSTVTGIVKWYLIGAPALPTVVVS